MFTGQTILIAPLDWGLGHASRMVPVIRELSEKNEVVLCATDNCSFLLKAYFPGLRREKISSYNIRYSRRLPQWLRIATDLPRILKVIAAEKKECRRLIKKYSAGVTISDNRYGFYSPGIFSVFVTHQLRFKIPVLGAFAGFLQKIYLKRFNEIWIPDFPQEQRRLSGVLANSALSKRFIGPQSALTVTAAEKQHPVDFLILLSGPEPQRTMLETVLLKVYSQTNLKVVLVRGTHAPLKHAQGKIEVIHMASGGVLRGLIEAADIVISRSGYSTLMDLHLMGKKNIVLVPTPGQPEQEYLARHWQKKFGATVVRQHQITEQLPGQLGQNSFTP